MNILRANPQQNVTGLQAGTFTGRALGKALDDDGRVMDRFLGLHHVDSDPPGSDLTEADVIGADFFCCVYGESITGCPIVNWENQDADDFTLQIQNGSTCFASLGGDVRPD